MYNHIRKQRSCTCAPNMRSYNVSHFLRKVHADMCHSHRTILEEYLADGGDQREAERCLRELNVPGVHFQFVKIAVTLGMQLCKLLV